MTMRCRRSRVRPTNRRAHLGSTGHRRSATVPAPRAGGTSQRTQGEFFNTPRAETRTRVEVLHREFLVHAADRGDAAGGRREERLIAQALSRTTSVEGKKVAGALPSRSSTARAAAVAISSTG
ncbi:hypothetical protein GCM10027200_05720 [Lentzea nigeriaca]